MAAEVTKPDFSYQWASGGSIVAPSTVKMQTGWGAEVPPFQWENYLQNRQDNAILHLFQKGISVWDSLSNYYFTSNGVRSYVQGSNGTIYVAVANSLNQNPTTDTTNTYWKKAFASPEDNLLRAGVVGAARNLRANIPAASASASFTADEVILKAALANTAYILPSINKTINLATVGAGGMDVGTAPVSGFVAVYLIYNPTTLTSALLGVNATAAAVSEIYSGANMPTGYTASALLSVLPTNASSQFAAGIIVDDRKVSVLPTLVTTVGTNNATYTSIGVPATPRNAKRVGGYVVHGGSSSGSLLASFLAGAATGSGELAFSATNSVVNGGYNMAFSDLILLTAQTIYYKNSSSIAGQAFSIYTSSYSI